MSILDPREPLVLELHELGRRPGNMQSVTRTVPAPADMGLGGVVQVPEGTDLELQLRLESVMEGVLVSATARAPMTGECVRCLDPIDTEIEVEFTELYAYPGSTTSEVADDGDEVSLQVVDELIDLEPAVRDAVVLALPSAPLCRDDCPGLCAHCGARLADDPGHEHRMTDPRWAALAGLLPENQAENDTSESGSNGAGPTKES